MNLASSRAKVNLLLRNLLRTIHYLSTIYYSDPIFCNTTIFYLINLGGRNGPDGTAACRNPFDLPTIYSTAITAQSNSASIDTYPDNLVDGQWQNLVGNSAKGNKNQLLLKLKSKTSLLQTPFHDHFCYF